METSREAFIKMYIETYKLVAESHCSILVICLKVPKLTFGNRLLMCINRADNLFDVNLIGDKVS